MESKSWLLAFAFVSVFGVFPAAACNIPVFRYALERWRSDAYEVIVFHDARLTVQQNAFVKMLEATAAESNQTANLTFTLSRVGTPAGGQHAELWNRMQTNADAKLPYLVVRTTVRDKAIHCWHGSLNEAIEAEILQSPARAKIARRLLDGDAVVWLIIGSDDAKRTAATHAMLKDSFPKLNEKVSIPDGVGLPGSELFSEVPLLVQFSSLKIDRHDPKEQFLVRLLGGLQQEAFDDGEPLIVPVFGRGRALEVIPASQLNQQVIEDLTVFLSGPCSCQVKDRNPGFDLLLAVDWSTELFGDDGEQPPALSPNRPVGAPKLLTIPPGRKR